MIARRARDEKSNVRKAALQVIEAFAVNVGVHPTASQLKALSQACNDMAVSVRKQSLASMTAILEANPTESRFRNAWLDAALPLVVDGEETVRTRCSEMLEDFLLRPITVPSECTMARCELGWKLLELIDSKQDLRRYLQRLCVC